MECPLCDKAHEVEERRRSTTLVVKGLELLVICMRRRRTKIQIVGR